MNAQSLPRCLSLFSLGLGFAKLLAPREVARLAGINDDHDQLIRGLGLRDIASSVGIMQGRVSHFLWSRVAGDVADLALLAAATRSDRNDRSRLNIALGTVGGLTVVDLVASILATRDEAATWSFSRHDGDTARIESERPSHLQAIDDPAFDRPFFGHNELDALAEDDDGLGENTRPADAPDTSRNVPL